ncbi:MAG: Error-prone repair protein ImuA [Sphingobacteriales bacterium]|nr:MAG: Error-prone repair protein ImuA [Sphingobacteriales bacterium]
MTQGAAKYDMIRQLQQEVLRLQGYRRSAGSLAMHKGLGPIEAAFPGKTFPTGAVHEFISAGPEDAAATNGFISGLLGGLLRGAGVCLWISTSRTVFPPALKLFGLDPDRIIFLDLQKPKDALWSLEEALKCEAVAAVVGEIAELGFTESRRLQLAVEQSRVTGFIHRCRPRKENTVACLTRWKIRPLPSITEDGMPGPGFPRWQVQLVKVRNGRPGTWELEWTDAGFRHVSRQSMDFTELQTRKAG